MKQRKRLRSTIENEEMAIIMIIRCCKHFAALDNGNDGSVVVLLTMMNIRILRRVNMMMKLSLQTLEQLWKPTLEIYGLEVIFCPNRSSLH